MSDKPKKPIFKKWWFWVVVVLVIGVIGAAAGGSDGGQSSASQPPAQSSGPAAASPAGTETEQAEPSQEAEPSNIFHVGDTLETSSLRITYQECEADWKGYSQYLGPSDGNKIIRAYFVFENIGSTDQYCGLFDFDCYADGVTCDQYFWETDESLPQASHRRAAKVRVMSALRCREARKQSSWNMKPHFGRRTKSFLL